MRTPEKIAEMLHLRKMSLKDLAARTGIKYNTLANYLKPSLERVPSATNGVVIARALEVPAEWLFDDSQSLPPPPFSDGLNVTLPPPLDTVPPERVYFLVAEFVIKDLLESAKAALHQATRSHTDGNLPSLRSELNRFNEYWNTFTTILFAAPQYDTRVALNLLEASQQFVQLVIESNELMKRRPPSGAVE